MLYREVSLLNLVTFFFALPWIRPGLCGSNNASMYMMLVSLSASYRVFFRVLSRITVGKYIWYFEDKVIFSFNQLPQKKYDT